MTALRTRPRRLPIGAEPTPWGVDFRVWAPRANRVEVVFEGASHALRAEGNGYHRANVEGLGAGARYRFRLDGGERLLKDPASRFQPEGPHGPSEVVDPRAFRWTDAEWGGVSLLGQVLYEMHVGTFAPGGTFAAAAEELPSLVELGITVIEVMPVADFPGRFGWGYDGVDLYAPTRLYGRPDDFRAFVDRAHRLGLGVILDVVYNHFGPDGNLLAAFSDHWFSDRYDNEWGDAIAFDGPSSGPVREFFVENAGYWIDEFHLDGLRLDATQSIHDSSPDHVMAAIVRRARAAAGRRSIVVVGENEPQETRLVRPPEEGGIGLDGLWNDDFHHAATVALTGQAEAYFSDYRGSAQELVSAVRHGFLYQGQRSTWQGKGRGTSAGGVPPHAFISFLQNHDQVANAPGSRRCHAFASAGGLRAMTALLLLGPHTPMLFQGQEFRASSPFHFFADHQGDLGEEVDRGRRGFLSQFPRHRIEEAAARSPRPMDAAAFEESCLDLAERERHAAAWRLHRDLLRLRREDPVLRPAARRPVEGATLSSRAFVLRWFGEGGDDRLLVVNLGRDLRLDVVPEPLLAPVTPAGWRTVFSTEDAEYGGSGTPPLEVDGEWSLPARAAVLLAPAK